MFKSYFVGSLSYAKASALSVMSEFSFLMASAPSVAVVESKLNSLEKQISDLAALVKSILEKDLLFMKYASNNFANFLVGVSKDIACLRSKVDFGDMDYDDMQTAKSSLLSKNTVERAIALWWMSDAEVRGSVESTRLFLSEFIFDSRNLNGVIEKIRGLGLFPLPIVSA
ncbi:hypothetical protein G9A89_020485 [Geosiphon pyriformis]|nr:hypothetical protein G9A89_020485 [Geosiphon pyriformis]